MVQRWNFKFSFRRDWNDEVEKFFHATRRNIEYAWKQTSETVLLQDNLSCYLNFQGETPSLANNRGLVQRKKRNFNEVDDTVKVNDLDFRRASLPSQENFISVSVQLWESH